MKQSIKEERNNSIEQLQAILEELRQIKTPDQHLNNAIDLIFRLKFKLEKDE